jgi:hypothetical protein
MSLWQRLQACRFPTEHELAAQRGWDARHTLRAMSDAECYALPYREFLALGVAAGWITRADADADLAAVDPSEWDVGLNPAAPRALTRKGVVA